MYVGGSDLQGVSAGQNADGRLEIMATGGNGSLYDYYQTVGGGWSGWQFVAAADFAGATQLVQAASGQLVVFGLTSAGILHFTSQTQKNGAWIAATKEAVWGFALSSFAIARVDNGLLLAVAADDTDCSCYAAVQTDKNDLTLASIDGPAIPCPATSSSINFKSFKADPASIDKGQSSTLSWNIEVQPECGVNQITLASQVAGSAAVPIVRPGLGWALQDQYGVSPEVQTNYLLQISCVGTSVSKQKTVTVSIKSAPPPQVHLILSFPDGVQDEDPHKPFNIRVLVSNVGNLATMPFQVEFLLNGVQSSQSPTYTLQPNTSVSVTTSIAGVDVGNYTLERTIPQYPQAVLEAPVAVS